MKKILSMVLALMIVMSCMTVAFADENPCAHDWKYTEIPTSGTHTKSCDLCGTSETEDCTGCDFTDGCELCGAELLGIHPDKDGDAHCDGCKYPLDHEDEFQHDENKHWIVCSNDEMKVFMVEEHSWGEWTETKAATEEAEGEEARECEVCERTETRKTDKLEHKHKYTHDSKVVAPTCEEKGYTENFCKCGDSEKVDYVDAKDHTWGEWNVTKEATYKEEGEKTRTCTVETCKKVETAKIDKIAHECEAAEELKNKKDATCIEKGYTGDVICKLCEGVMKAGEVIVATGHDEKNAEVVNKVDATCKKDGYTGDLKCKVCKEIIKKGEVVKKLGHDFVDHDKDPKTEKQCSRCKIGESNPDTGDKIMAAVCVMGASVVALTACAFVYKKKFA